VTAYDRLQEMTKARRPDRCIEAVGSEAHYAGYTDAIVVGAGMDRAHALREAIMCCGKAAPVRVS